MYRLSAQERYEITDYTKRRAREIGVEVRQSKRKGKKIDVYKDGVYLHSIGALGMGDYPTYWKQEGKEKADERRRLYYERHPKNSLGELLAKWLLW